MVKLAIGLSMLLLCGTANAADVTLSVKALDNCFDLQKNSLVKPDTIRLDNGRYIVSMSSNNAKYNGNNMPVDKVAIAVAGDTNNKGMFYTINAGESTVIDVAGVLNEGANIYGYYPDLICGDNTGGSVLTFSKVCK